MPIPFLIAGAALLAGGYGVKKGLDAKEKFDEAKSISSSAQRRYKKAQEKLVDDRETTNGMLEDFGRYKVEVFMTSIQALVDVLSRVKNASSELSDVGALITTEEMAAIKQKVVEAMEVHHAATGISAGLATAGGVYAAVGALGSASTGASIAGLSGAAATNATLAWLGGGAVAAGGGGMAVGTAVLGGLVAAPALLIGGLVMDSKAQEQLTAAHEFVAKVESTIAEIAKTRTLMKGYRSNIAELKNVIGEVVLRFEQLLERTMGVPEARRYDLATNEHLKTLITVGKGLKELLSVPVMAADGKVNDVMKVVTQSRGVLRVSGEAA